MTVSIVSHGQAGHVLRLLHDLDRTAKREKPLPVILTLNIPEAQPASEDFPRLRITVVRNPVPRGFAANHNAAFLRCKTRWFAVLNPDLELASDPFPELMDAGDRDESVALVTPMVVNSRSEIEDHIRANLTPCSLLRRRLGFPDNVDPSTRAQQPYSFYWFAGMFMLFKSAAFRDVGGFDEKFFLYCEDYDVCARLYLSNYSLLLIPNIVVVHNAQRHSHRSLRHLRLHVTSLVKVWLSRTFWVILFSGTETSRVEEDA